MAENNAPRVSEILSVIRRDRKKLLICNIIFFGLFLATSIYVGLYATQIHYFIVDTLAKSFESDPLLSVAYRAYYVERDFLKAVFITFTVNYFVGAFLTITLSGFLFLTIPFAALRAILWGALLPISLFHKYLPAIPTLVLEGESYVIAMVTGLNISLAIINPRKYYSVNSRAEALLSTVKELKIYYLIIALILFVAAVIEVLTVFTIKAIA